MEKFNDNYTPLKQYSTGQNLSTKKNGFRLKQNKKTAPVRTKREASNAYKEYKAKKDAHKKELTAKKMIAIIIGVLVISLQMYIIYRSSTADELNKEKNKVKLLIEEQKKENEQLNNNLQNQISLTKIEEIAKYKLGMQKLDTNKIIKLSLKSKDFIEAGSVHVVHNKEKNLFEKLWDKFMDMI